MLQSCSHAFFFQELYLHMHTCVRLSYLSQAISTRKWRGIIPLGAQTRTDVLPYISLIPVFGYLWPGTSTTTPPPSPKPGRHRAFHHFLPMPSARSPGFSLHQSTVHKSNIKSIPKCPENQPYIHYLEIIIIILYAQSVPLNGSSPPTHPPTPQDHGKQPFAYKASARTPRLPRMISRPPKNPSRSRKHNGIYEHYIHTPSTNPAKQPIKFQYPATHIHRNAYPPSCPDVDSPHRIGQLSYCFFFFSFLFSPFSFSSLSPSFLPSLSPSLPPPPIHQPHRIQLPV